MIIIICEVINLITNGFLIGSFFVCLFFFEICDQMYDLWVINQLLLTLLVVLMN